MADYLFGETSTGGFNLAGGSTVWARQFTASSDADVTEIQIYSRVAGNAKASLYTDSGGSPDTLLTSNDTDTACSSSSWNTISVTSASVSSGSDYWIVAAGSVAGVCSQVSGSGGTTEYLSSSYASWTAPSTWAGGNSSSVDCTFAAFGSTSTSYESDLGTGIMALSSGSPTTTLGLASDLGTGAMALGASSLTVADAALGTGVMSIGSTGVGSIANLNSELGTGALSLGANGVTVFDRYEAELGTGNILLSGAALDQLFSYDSTIGTGNIALAGGSLLTVDQSGTTFNQPRRSAEQYEFMRGCVFGDNLVSGHRVKLGGGSLVGSPTFGASVVLDGLSFLTYNSQPLTDTFSAVIKFSASAASSGLLFGTTDPISASLEGWKVWVDGTGVRANHSDGSAMGTVCSLDFDYHDDSVHTATYVVNLITGDHTLYVDDESDTQSTSATGTIGTGKDISIGGVGFIGTVKTARLFNTVFSAAEHAVYYADSIPSLLDDAISVYRCDAVSDETDHIWSKNLTMLDLTKGDGVSAGYPTQTGGHYVFDGVDDYVSDWPIQPTLHTDSIAKTTSYPDGIPVIQQVNDDTVKTLLTTGGSYTGNLHSLVLCTGALTTLEKNFLEWSQLKRLWRETHVNPFIAHLIREDVNVLACHFDVFSDPLNDYSGTGATLTPSLVTWDDGLQFTNASSVMTVDDDASLRCDSVTIHVSGEFDFVGSAFPTIETIVEKGANYSFKVIYVESLMYFVFNGTNFSSISNGGIYSVAVACIDGANPRLYVNGDFIEEASGSVTVDDTATDDLLIGNTSGGSLSLSGSTAELAVFNTVLSDAEIRLLHNYSVGIATATPYSHPYNILVDGNMDTVGVADWTSSSGAVLTKTVENRTGEFGVRTLCVECPLGDAFSAARQTVLTSGIDYHITGWAKSDGVNSIARIGNVTGSDIATITATTTWTYFDETFTAAGAFLYLSSFGNGATSDMVWFDDVFIEVD